MPEVEEVTPKGVVAILIGPDGRVISSATSFSESGPCGFSKQEVQHIRAKDALALASVRELSSPLLSKSVDNYKARQLLDEMCKHGCRVIFVPIGYDEQEEDACKK